MVVRTEKLEAIIDAPHLVEVPAGAKWVKIDVRTELRNVSEDDVVLHLASQEDALFWHVLNENHREIQRKESKARKISGKKKFESCQSQTIAAGHSTHESESLTLSTAKLRDGKTYTIRAQLWGQMAETDFTVVSPTKAKAKPKPKAKPRPKPKAKYQPKAKSTSKRRSATKKKA